MIRLRFVALAACLGVAASTAHAAPSKSGYSKSYDACMAKAKTTFDMNQCNVGELKPRNAALNAAYAKALERAGTAANALKAAERAWIAYRDADCGVYEDRNQFGTLGTVEAGGCMVERTIERTRALEAFASDQPG